jgi:hypothetical protein
MPRGDNIRRNNHYYLRPPTKVVVQLAEREPTGLNVVAGTSRTFVVHGATADQVFALLTGAVAAQAEEVREGNPDVPTLAERVEQGRQRREEQGRFGPQDELAAG